MYCLIEWGESRRAEVIAEERRQHNRCAYQEHHGSKHHQHSLGETALACLQLDIDDCCIVDGQQSCNGIEPPRQSSRRVPEPSASNSYRHC